MKTEIKKEEATNENNVTTIEVTVESELRRVPVRFRIASKWVLVLIAIAERTGVKTANIVETIITEHLTKRTGLLELMAMEEEKGEVGMFAQLGNLRPLQIFNLLNIYLKVHDKAFDFASETNIQPEAKIFNYLDSESLLTIFKKYFAANGVTTPTLDELIAIAGKGYQYIAAWGKAPIVNISDRELKEILLKIK